MKKEKRSSKWFAGLPLQTKLTGIILLTVLIPLTTTAIIISGRIRPMTIAESIREEQVETAKAVPVLNGFLNGVISAANSIRSGEMTAAGAVSDSDNLSAVRQYIDLPADDPFFSEPGHESFSPMDSVRGTYWYGIITSTRQTSLFCPPRYLGVQERTTYADCAYVSATRFNDTEKGSMLTYLVLYFPSSALQEILTANLTHSESVSYIANERDETVTSTNPTVSGIYYMDYSSIQNSLMSSNGFLEREVLGETVYLSYFYISPAAWYLVTVTPEGPLESQAWGAMLLIGGIYMASAAAALLISTLLARSIAKRIGTVSKQMSEVKNAPPVPLDPPEIRDEIGELTDSYNYMAGQINQLMEDQKNASEELRAAEFDSLQAQINPHFLFNTMEMINQLASTGRIEETNEAITALSRFYRLTLSRKGTMSTIENEIEHVNAYIKIQNMRFDNGIDFMVDVPDELLDCSIPRLTLQPIVENSILHGILERPDRRGSIVLTGWMEEDDACILISDNGVGIEPERMEKILTGELSSGQGAQIAVVNTHRRIVLAFGEEYGLSYSSKPGRGTDVTVRIAARS